MRRGANFLFLFPPQHYFFSLSFPNAKLNLPKIVPFTSGNQKLQGSKKIEGEAFSNRAFPKDLWLIALCDDGHYHDRGWRHFFNQVFNPKQFSNNELKWSNCCLTVPSISHDKLKIIFWECGLLVVLLLTAVRMVCFFQWSSNRSVRCYGQGPASHH